MVFSTPNKAPSALLLLTTREPPAEDVENSFKYIVPVVIFTSEPIVKGLPPNRIPLIITSCLNVVLGRTVMPDAVNGLNSFRKSVIKAFWTVTLFSTWRLDRLASVSFCTNAVHVIIPCSERNVHAVPAGHATGTL